MTDRERLQVAIDEALTYLSDAERGATATADLPARVVQRGDAETRKKLGDAIYDLARRCATADPEIGASTAMSDAPLRDGEALQQSVRARAARSGAQISPTSLPRAGELEPVDQAITALEQLEGVTDRSNYLKCMRATAARDWGAVIKLARSLVESAGSIEVQQYARQEVVFGLLRMERFDEAIAEGLDYETLFSPNQILAFNVAYAYAATGCPEEFAEWAVKFQNAASRDGSDEFWRAAVETHHPVIEAGIGIDRVATQTAFGL